MGNNHDKFFSKDKRKLLILGVQHSGKSTLVQTLSPGTQLDQKQDLQIVDIKLKNITLCDMGGNERQRIFWRQNYYGSQGVIYVVDSGKDVHKALSELEKVTKDADLTEVVYPHQQTPIAVFLNKLTKEGDYIAEVYKFVEELKERYPKKKLQVFEGSTKEQDSIVKCIEWLGKEMKAI